MVRRAGRLRHRVTIQDHFITPNSVGEPEATWVDHAAYVAARVTPIGATERWAAQQVNPEITHEVEIRYVSGITADMRIVFEDRCLNVIGALDEDGDKRRLLVHCTEVHP